MQALVTPEALDPLAVASPAFPGQQHVDTSIPVAGMTSSQEMQPCPKLGLPGASHTTVTLRRTVLTDTAARSTLGNPETIPQTHYGSAATFRG